MFILFFEHFLDSALLIRKEDVFLFCSIFSAETDENLLTKNK